jgi:hypothetical protein
VVAFGSLETRELVRFGFIVEEDLFVQLLIAMPQLSTLELWDVKLPNLRSLAAAHRHSPTSAFMTVSS